MHNITCAVGDHGSAGTATCASAKTDEKNSGAMRVQLVFKDKNHTFSGVLIFAGAQVTRVDWCPSRFGTIPVTNPKTGAVATVYRYR